MPVRVSLWTSVDLYSFLVPSDIQSTRAEIELGHLQLPLKGLDFIVNVYKDVSRRVYHKAINTKKYQYNQGLSSSPVIQEKIERKNTEIHLLFQ